MFSFLRTSVDKVVSDLTKKVEQLYQLEKQHLKDVETHAASVARAEYDKVVASNAADRARRIGDKIKELVS